MRACLAMAILAIVITLCGCGGGSPGLPRVDDSSLLGIWVVMPTSSLSGRSAFSSCPTSTLGLRQDGTFRVEDGSPSVWAGGRFSVIDNALNLSVQEKHGAVNFLQGSSISFAFIDVKHLAVTEETPAGDRTYTLLRLVDGVAPIFAREWLMVRRQTADARELPCVDSVRLQVNSDGKATLFECLYADKRLMSGSGELLMTNAGALALRINGGSSMEGRLNMLGEYAVTDAALAFAIPGGEMTLCAARTAPDNRLPGEWQCTAGSSRLCLRSDGTYTLTEGGAMETGQWRTYQGRYLCLISATTQKTFSWDICLPSTTPYLVLGSWYLDDAGVGHYEETAWFGA